MREVTARARQVVRSVCLLAVVLLATVVAVAPAAATAGPGAKSDREWLDIEIFTHVPDPGHPEGILVGPNGTVYVATHQHAVETPGPPSKIFAYDRDGEFLREYVIEGQDLDKGPGLVGMGMDADGLIYVIDRHPYRVITIDPATGEQNDYATFRDVETCLPLLTQEECAESLLKRNSLPDDLTFAEDGTMYVTDVRQNLIWRVPRGGGDAEVWFTDTRLDSVFGPNGVEVMPDGETLMFVQSFTGPFDGVPPRPDTGRLYTLTVQPDGSPGELDLFWESEPGGIPDGFAIARSGNIYVALAVANSLAVISPEGEELGRNPANHVENMLLEVPMDSPGSVVFLDDRVLMTNHSFLVGNPNSFVVYDIYAGEKGLQPFRPQIN